MKRAFALRNWAVFFAIVLPGLWAVAASPRLPLLRHYEGIGCPLYHHRISSHSPLLLLCAIIAGTFLPGVCCCRKPLSPLAGKKRWSRADRLLVVWAIVVVLFFSVSQSKLPGYILTAVVALGI